MKRKKGQQIEMFAAPQPEAVKAAPVAKELTPQAEKLLANFEVFSQAEGGIKKLRELVLELAVRGRLVTNEGDSQSLQRVNRFDTTQQTLVSTNVYPLPPAWCWAPIASFCEVIGGIQKTPLRAPREHHYPYLRVENVQRGRIDLARLERFELGAGDLERWRLVRGDLLIVEGNGSATEIGRCAIWQGSVADCVHQNHLIRCRPNPTVDGEFVLRFLNSPTGSETLRQLAITTSGLYSLSVGKIRKVLVPLPPLAEQKRIVAKVDELMKLCDELETRQAKQRETGARLTKSALDALAQADGPEELATAWERVVGNFEGLVSRADDVKKVRETVLSLAVRGRLVEQEKYSTNYSPNTANSMLASEHLFGIPSNWHWECLESVVQSVTDGDHQPPPQSATGIPFLTIGNISSGYIDFDASRFVPKEYYDSLDPRRVPQQGDILYTVVGASYGRAVLITDHQKFCIQRHIAIIKPANQCDTNYLLLFLNSPIAYAQATKAITGTAQPTVPLKPLRKFKIPLPPLAEQKRIVAKVDQLMGLCDELEAKLRLAEETSRKVAEALVAELLQA